MKQNPASQESERASSAPEGVKGLRACAGWTGKEGACCNETPCQWGDHPCERKIPIGIELDWQSTPALWAATRPDYDGAPDSKHPMGFGKTKEAAAADLLEQEEERL